jgi:formate C-acetyltransferase
MAAIDPKYTASSNVVNIILPSGKTDLDICEAFLRSIAGTALLCLQLNVVTKEQLLEAKKNPEAYKNLIVRVTGFSARFTSLSEGWQDEVLSRNYYN